LCGYSVSIFTRWGETIDQVWVKSRVTDEPEQVESALFGAGAAAVDRHPILGLDASSCTPQLGRRGPWADRLPHFRMGFTPSSGEELQSEYLFPRRNAVEAIEAVRARSALRAHVRLHPSSRAAGPARSIPQFVVGSKCSW
jgi:xylitol oxidase